MISPTRLLLVVGLSFTMLAFTSIPALGGSLSVEAWNQAILTHPPTQAGCFISSYPDTAWYTTQCVKVPQVPLNVGNGWDYAGQASPGSLIGLTQASFSMTGFTSEWDSGFGGPVTGRNYYTIQVNSQYFGTTYGGNNYPVTAWQQFVFQNTPTGLGAGGFVFMEYWLFNYVSQYGPCSTVLPFPGIVSPWATSGNSCFSNSYAVNAGVHNPSGLNSYRLNAYSNFLGSPYDVSTFCSGGTCYSVSVWDYALNLYQHWQSSEIDVVGWGGGSTANFNTVGISIVVNGGMATGSNTYFNVACYGPSMTWGTTEQNNLILGTCTPGHGAYSVNEY